MDSIVLFGDSLTEQSSDQSNGFAFQPALQNLYMRRFDVINRGYSGYNTEMALRVLPHAIAPLPADPAHGGRIQLFSILLGANDARLPDTMGFRQHVSAADFGKNLQAILDHPAVKAHAPRLVLVTPPPIDERMTRADDATREIMQQRRRADITAEYAKVVRELGKQRGVPVVDLWAAFMLKAGWNQDAGGPLPGSNQLEPNPALMGLLRDGLHFTGAGYKLYFDTWIATVTKAYPELEPETVARVFPEWDSAERWDNFKGPAKTV